MIRSKYTKFSLIFAVLASAPVAVFADTPAPATQPSASAPAEPTPVAGDGTKLDSTLARLGYVLGVQVAGQIKQLKEQTGFDIAADSVIAGLKDGEAGKPVLTKDQMKTTVTEFSQMAMEKSKLITAEALAKNEAFLAKNKTAEGVKTTASGLQIKTIKEGDGKTPVATDTVSVHYKGTLIDGTVFDESTKDPVTFQLNRVIPGWTEGVQLMKVGGKYQLFIPAAQAYGANPPPNSAIPPNATLIFEIELLSIGEPTPPPAAK